MSGPLILADFPLKLCAVASVLLGDPTRPPASRLHRLQPRLTPPLMNAGRVVRESSSPVSQLLGEQRPVRQANGAEGCAASDRRSPTACTATRGLRSSCTGSRGNARWSRRSGRAGSGALRSGTRGSPAPRRCCGSGRSSREPSQLFPSVVVSWPGPEWKPDDPWVPGGSWRRRERLLTLCSLLTTGCRCNRR